MPAPAKRSASHRMATRTWNRCGVKAEPKPASVSWWLCPAGEFYGLAHEHDLIRRTRQATANYQRRDVA